MNHAFDPRCAGCQLCSRLQEEDPARQLILHRLIQNYWLYQRIAEEADEIGFDIEDELIESCMGDIYDENEAMQMAGSATHH